MKDYSSKVPPKGKTRFRIPKSILFKNIFKLYRAKESLARFQRKFLSKFEKFSGRFRK